MTTNPFVKSSIEKSVQDLPALPNVVTRILKETEDPESCTQTIERMIGTEPALASKVLRVVNSAYYGLSGQVTSLGQAIVILGLQQIRNLVLSVSAFGTLKAKTPNQIDTMEQFWLHSFGTAAATQIISTKKGLTLDECESACVGGLLHDIGRLFLFANFGQTYTQVIRHAEQKKLEMEVVEKRLLGLTHSEVGRQMAIHWKLPKTLVHLIGGHEGPFSPEVVDPLLFTLHVADWLTKGLYFGTDEIPTKTPPAVVMDWLNFSPEQLDWLETEVEAKVDEARQLYGLMAA
ncbi:MAG: hypothetical protein BGO01_08115 [Armatimonadetes bacterium 55-13]|nr:HDOD domain-containing protein [Armatimonadota bacterium]OJU62438.1 MAG: hypothetical protein BGO01_08115 [Armatimonadetes bacterium 55-13]